jgi:hypothetical protein
LPRRELRACHDVSQTLLFEVGLQHGQVLEVLEQDLAEPAVAEDRKRVAEVDVVATGASELRGCNDAVTEGRKLRAILLQLVHAGRGVVECPEDAVKRREVEEVLRLWFEAARSVRDALRNDPRRRYVLRVDDGRGTHR